MINTIKGLMMNISTIMIFVKIVEMILPEGKLNKYTKFIIGIITLIVIISPFAKMIKGGKELEIPDIEKYYNNIENIDSNNTLDKIQEKQIISVYKTNLEKNIKELIGQKEKYICKNVECNIKENGEIENITIYMENKPVIENKIKIEIKDQKKEENIMPQNIEKEIINTIVSTYNVKQANITVILL